MVAGRPLQCISGAFSQNENSLRVVSRRQQKILPPFGLVRFDPADVGDASGDRGSDTGGAAGVAGGKIANVSDGMSSKFDPTKKYNEPGGVNTLLTTNNMSKN